MHDRGSGGGGLTLSRALAGLAPEPDLSSDELQDPQRILAQLAEEEAAQVSSGVRLRLDLTVPLVRADRLNVNRRGGDFELEGLGRE